MKKLILLICLFVFTRLMAQLNDWTSFTYNSNVRTIAQEGDILWIGTTGGLVRYDRTTQEKVYYNTSNSPLPFNYINAIVIDSQGTKWIGTGDSGSSWGGLVSFDGFSWTVYETLDSGLGHNCILSLAIDHQGVLWVGTYNGLQKYDGTNWTLYHTNNTDQDLQIILSLAVDSHNALWVGTEWYGLKKFDGGIWTNFTDPLGYCQSASCLTFAPDGALWLSGYQPYGMGALLKFNGTEWTTFTEVQMGAYFYEVDSIG
ncbi:MAG TPA: two-component regulator propeller domain-containing protein, partial [Candidatus Cloacimonadota bacterium]|nr:two-component regulator propeller domain-containing protein [Candidatus Cloacimonadota bacterium]